MILISLAYFFRPKKPEGYKKINDLVRGKIFAPLNKLWDIYLQFKDIDGIEVVHIEDKLKDLFYIKINFIFEEAFIGEMKFQYKDHSESQYTNLFYSEIENAKAKIEII